MDPFKTAIQKYYTDSEAYKEAYEIIKDKSFDTDPIVKAFKLFLLSLFKEGDWEEDHPDLGKEIQEFSQQDLPAEAVFFMRNALIECGLGNDANNIMFRHFGIEEEEEKALEVPEVSEVLEEKAEEVSKVSEVLPVAPLDTDAEEVEEKELVAPKFPKLARQNNFSPANAKGGSKGKKGRSHKGRKTRRTSSLEKKASKRKA